MNTNASLTVGSLFCGIGGFDLGAENAGMKCVWQAEIDKTCNGVRKRHWLNMETITDVRDVRAANGLVRPDLVCGGFPCQDLSVAGKRAGLAGERSGLWFEFRRVIAEFLPRWVLIENVPGLLSSDGGRDMGTILWSLGKLGYGWAYRVLDAQYFGVAQRRRRVFIVGCFGNVRSACEVLFESDCVPWHPAPSRETGARVAYAVAAGAGGSKFGSGRDGQDMVSNHHDHLKDAKIAIAWMFGKKADADGRMTLGRCRKGSDLDRSLHGYDFVILLNHEAWNKFLNEDQQRALVDHELCHAAVANDSNGEPKTDEMGRTCYRLRKHDIEEFKDVVSRHGQWKDDIQEFVAACSDDHDRPLLHPEHPHAAASKAAS